MLKRFVIILCAMFMFICMARAQSEAGKSAFAILNLYNSAQMTARGLDFLPKFSNEACISVLNPATLNPKQNHSMNLTYTDIFAGSYQGALAYTHTFNGIGSFGLSLAYINYGSFTMTEANGDQSGTFSAYDMLLSIGYGLQVEKNIYVGVTFKPLISHYESYNSSALAFDLSAMWASNNKDWQAGIIVKNLGKQISSFASKKESLPFDIQAGISKQFAHAPLTLYVVADRLTKWDIREDDALNPRDELGIDGSVKKENSFSKFIDKGFRHLHFAVDITPSKYFYLSFGYSWRQHQEMNVDDAFSLAGLSYGLGIMYKQFTLNYARNEYHNYGAPNYITLGYRF